MTAQIDSIIIFALMTSSAYGYLFTDYVSHQFHSDLNYSFIHQTLNNKAGWIYISAVNRLYQLDKNLQTKKTEVVTGPVNDSLSCTPYLPACDAEPRLTNNYNKVLLQDPERDRIIVCGSVYQGICETRSLQNIDQVLSEKSNCDCYKVSDYVSCLSWNCSTVAVITEGPTVYNPVLYVGSTYYKTIYRSDTKTITTRSLQVDPTRENTLFRYAVELRKKISALPLIESEEEPKDFKYVFETGDIDGFVYFLFQKNVSKSSTSVIARICKKDVYYNSYTEMMITCPGWDVSDNNQLLGAHYEQNLGQNFPVANSEDGVLYVMMRNATGSSLCIFSLKNLNDEFDYTAIACLRYKGMDPNSTTVVTEKLNKIMYCDKRNQKDNKDTPWISPDQTLDTIVFRADSSPELPYYKDYKIEKNSIRCRANYLPTLLKRVDPIIAVWSYHEPGLSFSAIASHLVQNEINVVFIGTLNGKLLHLNINSKQVYREFDVGFPVLSDLLLDDDSSLEVPHLYIMTSGSLYHTKVSACEQYTTCSSCLGALDPYCGWCILTRSCVPSTYTCPSGSWLKPLSQECINASEPEPVERTLSGDVVTKVNLLPVLQVSNMYECVFEGGAQSPATVDQSDPSTLTCTAPTTEELPQNSEGKDHVSVKLSIRFNSTTDIVSTTVVFYDCGAHGRTLDQFQPCYGCLNNRWTDKCQWCVASHSCMPRGQGSCIITSQDCPRIASAAVTSQLLSVGIQNQITMNVLNLPGDSELQCSIEIEGNAKKFVVDAQSSEDKTQVICDSNIYSYTMNQLKVPANVTIFWKPNYVIDSVQGSPISFYNCSMNHNDCSLCVSASKEFKCGWCGNQCTIESVCTSGTWVKDPTQCPDPVIESFSPSSGPLTGDTLVVIRGKNMGVSQDDIGGVEIAGTSCTVVGHKISNEISCRTDAVSEMISGFIKVTVRNVVKTSPDEFEYRNPVLHGLTVPAGPMSGGTTITITGENLNTGSKIKVYIGTNLSLKCEVILPLKSNSELQCVTSPSHTVMMNQTVSVHFDSYTAELERAFSYMQNPTIRSNSTASGRLACFIAGGRQINMVGSRLDLVQKANLKTTTDFSSYSNKMMSQVATSKIARRKKRTLMERVINTMNGRTRKKRSTIKIIRHFISPCDIQNATHMNCSSATISLTIGDNFTTNVSDTLFLRADLELELDSLTLPLGGLKYFPNPVVNDLSDEEQKKDRTGSTWLKIDALNLNHNAVTKEEVEIRIGDKLCPVNSMDENGLLCAIPKQDDGHPTNLEVTVRIGNKLWTIGKAYFGKLPEAVQPAVMWVLIVLGIVIVIAVPFGVWYCFRKNKHYKENKNDFQKAIENLEMSVRADFRKAFAELSIDMTDLTADIGDVGLPVLSYRQYATNIFFPSVRFHPCMKEPDPREKPIPAVEQGLIQFSLLISTKQFLILFIRTLEEQKSFSNRDKGNVASLITVVLHKQLAYFTEVMKSLISECVEVTVQKNPKLVLRRTESVAERIFSNWIAIFLFPYIRDRAGKPIFLLHKAIKHQVSKGALDVVTGKARYTLSDDRLLKEDIVTDTVTLFVSQSDNSDDEPVIVKVLSCDAIAQIKEKVMDTLYKRIPYSQRPKPDQVDLEWRHGRSGHLVLPDIDYACEPGNRWKRVMTLKDYKVENNATMSLVLRQQNMYASQDFVSHIGNQSIDTSALSPMLPEDSMKTYHLVKYADDIEQKRESTIPRDRHKHILDLYLLRLINMKGILQSYVDEVFQVILDTNKIPIAVKYFFDTLDELAETHGITDPEILHIWKTNSVLGRFWVTILKHPESVFDIDIPEAVESSMSVISQTFIDACSVQEHKPTKDSPINKQLYAKEIPTYKKMVQKYYKDVENMPPVSDQDISAHMTEISRSYDVEFDVHAALNELWGYVNKYYEEIQETLTNDSNTTQMVIQRLHQAYTLIDSSVNNP